MSTPAQPDPWLRGPVAGIPALLQPIAHAFIAAREDIDRATAGIGPEELWARPGGVASLGFQLAHLAGSTDRLLTYARGEALSESQRANLAACGESRAASEADLFRQLCVAEPRNIPDIPSAQRLDLTKNLSLPTRPDFHHRLPAREHAVAEARPKAEDLLTAFAETIRRGLEQLAVTDESTLTQPRAVGRAPAASTVLGLLFHAAEHAARHAGQMVTTAKLARAIPTPGTSA